MAGFIVQEHIACINLFIYSVEAFLSIDEAHSHVMVRYIFYPQSVRMFFNICLDRINILYTVI